MTNATHIQFAHRFASRNDGVLISDNCGSHVEVMVWINPTTRFHPTTKMVERKYITRVIGALRGNMATKFQEMGV